MVFDDPHFDVRIIDYDEPRTFDSDCVWYDDDSDQPLIMAISNWSKKAIIREAVSLELPQQCIDVLERMTLEDLRAVVLVYTGTHVVGKYKIRTHEDARKRRHTRFYRLDVDMVKALGGCA